MQVVRTEVAAQGAIVLLGWSRERRDRDRIRLVAHVHHPDVLHLVRTIIGDGLVGDDHVVFRYRHAVGERHGGVCSAPERWVQVAMRQQFRVGRIAEIDQRQPAVSPGTICDVPGNDRVVQRDAIAFLPGWLFAASRPHARQVPPTHLAWPSWI